MISILLVVAIAAGASAVSLAVYIMYRERTVSLQRIWELALAGQGLSRIYMVLVLIAFLAAVIAWFLVAATSS